MARASNLGDSGGYRFRSDCAPPENLVCKCETGTERVLRAGAGYELNNEPKKLGQNMRDLAVKHRRDLGDYWMIREWFEFEKKLSILLVLSVYRHKEPEYSH